MNKVIICGNLTKDPVVRYTAAQNSVNGQSQCIANYTLAVSRRDRDRTADYVPIVAFGKAGEFVEKYLHKGMKMLVSGHINTGSYKDQEGKTIYTWNVVAEDHEFVEKRQDASESRQSAPAPKTNSNTSAGFGAQEGFYDVAEEGLPWS